MYTHIHIFDGISPFICNGQILLWDSYTDDANIESILTYQEKFFYDTRDEFLRFVYNFGEYSIKGRPLREHLNLSDNESAWWLSKIFERHPSLFGQQLFEIFKLRALERYLATIYKPYIHFYSHNRDIASVISVFCQKNNIIFKFYTKKQITFREIFCRLRRYIKKIPLFAQIFVFLEVFRWLLNVRIHFPYKAKLQKRKGILLGTWFPNIDDKSAATGRFRSRYWESVHDILDNHSQHVHWFFVHPDPAEKIKENVLLRDKLVLNHPGCDMAFCEECITLPGIARAFLSYISISLKARILRKHLSGAAEWPDSKLNIFPLIYEIWNDSIQGKYLLHQLLYYEGVKKYCILIGGQKTLITSSELQFWERILFKKQRALGCKQIYAAQHSVIREADFRFFCDPRSWGLPEFISNMPDIFYANSAAAQNSLLATGFPSERLGLLEAVRFMYLSFEKFTTKKLKAKILLVATSYFQRETTRTLKILANAMAKKSLSMFEKIIIKPHPYLAVDDIKRELFVNPPPTVHGCIEEYLTDDTAVYSDSATSVGSLALHMGLPVIICSPVNAFDMGIIPRNSGVIFINNSTELINALMNLSNTTPCKDYFCLDPAIPRWRKLILNG